MRTKRNAPAKDARKPVLSKAAIIAAKNEVLAHEFEVLCARTVNIPELPMRELRFHKTRDWRFDFAWPQYGIALEVEGGVWTGGRHTRGSGFLKDMEKYNEAALCGWRVVRCTPQTLCSDATITMIARLLNGVRS